MPQTDRGLISWIFRRDQGRTSHHAQGENAFEYDIRSLGLLQTGLLQTGLLQTGLPQTGLPQRRISHTNRNRPIQTY